MTFVPRAWSEVIDPLAGRFEVAAKFGQTAVWNAEGSKAMAELMREMARIIDEEIIARTLKENEKVETMCTDWFEAKSENGGVMISNPSDPLGFVWQTPGQVREIIGKLHDALAVLELDATTPP